MDPPEERPGDDVASVSSVDSGCTMSSDSATRYLSSINSVVDASKATRVVADPSPMFAAAQLVDDSAVPIIASDPVLTAAPTRVDPEDHPGPTQIARTDTLTTTNTTRARRLITWVAAVGTSIIFIVVVFVVAIRIMGPENASLECTNVENGGEPSNSSLRRRVSERSTPFEKVGCFRRQSSVDMMRLNRGRLLEKAQACYEHCVTRHFGIVDSAMCVCFSESPIERLTIGSCSSMDCSSTVPLTDRMDTFFAKGSENITGATCQEEETTAVRNMLLNNNAPFLGFDIVSNEPRSSPFETHNNGCGTNMYEIRTEIPKGGNQLSTSSQLVSEFYMERRTKLTSSVSKSTDEDSGWWGLVASASVNISAALDQEQNAIFESTGAQSSKAKVLTALGVKRLAEFEMKDFFNNRYFVTFSPSFGAVLQRYKASGYARDVAQEIFAQYGMHVVERGVLGGFIELRATVTERVWETLFRSAEKCRRCFEAAVSEKASAMGFRGSFSVEEGTCSGEEASMMLNLQSHFAKQTSEPSANSLKMENGELAVNPEFSTLLTGRDKYPVGDDGLRLRLLSDFLHPDKVSPLEVKRFLLTETDFLEIKENLQVHILEELFSVGDALRQCGGCLLPYLMKSSGSLQCICYSPTSKDDDNLLVNGSFESNSVKATVYSYFKLDNVDGWKPYGNTQHMEIWGNGTLGIHPTDGKNLIELDVGPYAIEGYYQDIPTIVDQSYLLQFDMRARNSSLFHTDSENVVIEWCGTKTNSEGYHAATWETKTVMLKGTGGSCRLLVRESGTGNSSSGGTDGKGALVDNVRLTILE